MPLAFISQGRNTAIRTLVKNPTTVETAVANTWTVSSLLPGLNSRVLYSFSALNFKGQSPGSAGGGAGYTSGCYSGTARAGNGGIGIAGAFVNTNITKASSIGSYTITLGLAGNSAMNNSNNIQAGGRGGGARGAGQANGGTISSNLVFAGANTFIVPYGGAGGGGGSGGASGDGATGGAGNPGQAGLSANSAFFGKSGNGGERGSAACYSGTFTVADTAQTAIAFTQLSGATYIYPTNTAPPAHGITTWTSNNYGAGALGQISSPTYRTSNSTPAANGTGGIFRLTVSGIRI
jgi:hypothetical protein